jgi:hypothetical protein
MSACVFVKKENKTTKYILVFNSSLLHEDTEKKRTKLHRQKSIFSSLETDQMLIILLNPYLIVPRKRIKMS